MRANRDKPTDLATRVLSKCIPDGDCLVYSGAILRNGYGYMGWNVQGKSYNSLTHRVVYEATYGPIPDGLVIDHLCRNRACQNIQHLEAVTQKVNVNRGVNVGRPRVTHCARGHARTPDNTYFDKRGFTSCRACKRGASK